MAPTSFRKLLLAPLLFLLLVSGTAAAPTAERLYREARALFDRGERDAALKLTTAAMQRFAASDDAWAWRLRLLHADALLSASEEEQARAALQRPLPHSLAGTDIEVLRLRGAGVAALRAGDAAAAKSLLLRAYALARKQPATRLSVLLALATVDANNMRWAKEGLEIAQQEHNALAELRLRGTVGLALARQERFDEAIAIWEPGLARARALGDASLEQKFGGNLGWAYLELGDYEVAGAQFRRALTIALRNGERHDAVPWLYQLGNVLLQAGDLDEAQKQYRAAYDIAASTKHQQLAIVLASLGNAALKAGDLAAARRYAEQSLAERKNADEELRSRLLLGRIAIAEHKPQDAERVFKDVIARTKSKQTLWEAHGRLAQLYASTSNVDGADREFRLLLDTARETRASINEQQLRFAYFAAVAELFDSYVDFLVARGRAAEALAVTDKMRAQTLEEALTRDATALRDPRLLARQARSTILCYWLGRERSYLWVVTARAIELAHLPPRQTIESAVERYQRDLLGSRGTLATSGNRGVALWRTLVAPVSPALRPGARVIVVPDGRLHRFNMETLVAPSPKPHYWIEDVVVSTAGSLRLIASESAKPASAPRLLLVGNTPPPPGSAFPALPRAGVEMEKVARHFEVRSVLAGTKATPSAYLASHASSFGFLHFVAHGVATREKPLDSAIVLAADGDSFKLYARDIAKQKLSAELVTISSCHGAGTRAYAGEGLVGLGWAFLRAGADNVIAALWQVSDTTTPELMDRMYAGIRAGRDPATALRDAKLTLVHDAGAFRKPYYWAPFVLYSRS